MAARAGAARAEVVAIEEMSRPVGLLDRNPTRTAFRISYLANFYSGPVYRMVEREHGLLRPEFMVLFGLAEDGPLTSAEIGRSTGLPKNSLSRAVNRLLGSGLIARSPHPKDGRAASLTIRPEGLALYRRILPMFVSREQGLLSVLSAAERATLDRLLGRLVHRDDGWADPY